MKCLAPVLALSLIWTTLAHAELTVDSNFPGGSAKVLEIDPSERLIRLEPAPRPGRGWECWWYGRIGGLRAGETIRIEVGKAPWATPDRASYSFNRKTWQQTAPGTREGKRIRYELKAEGPEVWVAWGPPFVPADAKTLVEEAARESAAATAFTLCRTREGRDTPGLVVTSPKGDPSSRRNVWIQARQHAWESGSSWVARGFVEWLVSEDPRAAALRQEAVVTVIPVMDIDNVHRGAGGKDQKPQDHNRDWTAQAHWKAVAAAQQRILEQNEEGRFALFVDLHNPSARNRFPYYYVSPKDEMSEAGSRKLERFLEASKREITGPLRFTGKTLESGKQYDPEGWQAISKNWVLANCADHAVAVTLETPWNTPASNTQGYRTVGRQLGLAVERYLRP